MINPGNVGMPYGATGAHRALPHDGAVTLRRTRYDLDAACRRIAAESTYPDAATWADEYVHARVSAHRPAHLGCGYLTAGVTG